MGTKGLICLEPILKNIPPSLLIRPSSCPPVQASPIQGEIDGWVGGFVHQATDWRSLAAMVAGGVAGRVGRVGTMGLRVGAYGHTPLRIVSVGLGLSAEVSAFELTHRGLITLFGRGAPMWAPTNCGSECGRPHGAAPTSHGESNLWRWSGPGGLRQGLFQSFISFGALKGAGRLARGEDLVIQHLLQDSALILGHQAAGTFGIAPRPAGNLTEQFLHAEATPLQLGAGMALAHRFAPAVHGLERGLDLSVRSSNRSIVRSFDEPDPRAHELTNAPSNPFFQPAFALETLG